MFAPLRHPAVASSATTVLPQVRMYPLAPCRICRSVGVVSRPSRVRPLAEVRGHDRSQRYLRRKEERTKQRRFIPEDFTKSEFLKNFQRCFDANSNRAVVEAACYDEPHKRLRPSLDRRERHKHIVIKTFGNFAFLKIATAFEARYGLRLSFPFKQNGFGGSTSFITIFWLLKPYLPITYTLTYTLVDLNGLQPGSFKASSF